jgi:poly(beta-D-mannuronate) lyase
MRYLFALILLMATAHAECPAPPAAQRDIIADSYYDDPPVNSHIDPQRKAAYEAAVRPFEDYLRYVAASSSKGDKCAIEWLSAWAKGDGMLGKIENHQAHFERKWVLAGLALSYAKVRDHASDDERAKIDAWLKALAVGVRHYADTSKGKRNNHYYWEGLAVGATGAVTGDGEDVAWARAVFLYAMNQIEDDGSLPLEMARGSRALDYHLFAAAPLAMLESILNERSEKLDKLVGFCLAGLKNPDAIAARSHVAQLTPGASDMDWMIVYARRHPNPTINAALSDRKPHNNRLGGTLSLPNPLEHPLP